MIILPMVILLIYLNEILLVISLINQTIAYFVTLINLHYEYKIRATKTNIDEERYATKQRLLEG